MAWIILFAAVFVAKLAIGIGIRRYREHQIQKSIIRRYF